MALSAVPALYQRRLTLTVRTPRELLVPLVTPVLFAVIIAPALASIIAAPGARTAYMTFVALATAGLLIPLNTLFSGIGVIVWSERFRIRGYWAFSYSMKALGTGILYLSLWAAYALFHLVPASVALIAMIRK